jgi:hypothetical protein
MNILASGGSWRRLRQTAVGPRKRTPPVPSCGGPKQTCPGPLAMAEPGFFLGASEQTTAPLGRRAKSGTSMLMVALGRGMQTRQPKAFARLSPESVGSG